MSWAQRSAKLQARQAKEDRAAQARARAEAADREAKLEAARAARKAAQQRALRDAAEAAPPRCSAAYVARHFDAFADTFDARLAELGYVGHARVVEAAARAWAPRAASVGSGCLHSAGSAATASEALFRRTTRRLPRGSCSAFATLPPESRCNAPGAARGGQICTRCAGVACCLTSHR